MLSSTSTSKSRIATVFTISLLCTLISTASSLPVVPGSVASFRQSHVNVKMGIVPPHIQEQLASNPSLSEDQRGTAQKSLEKSREISHQKYEQSVHPLVPIQVLERLASKQTLVTECSDDVKKELQNILKNRVRWPSKPEVRVSNELRAVLDTNPGLWKPATCQEGESGQQGEEK